MALKTKVRLTKHFYYRVMTCKRLGEEHGLHYAFKTFDKIMKKVKKGRIRPFPGREEGKFGVYFKGLIYIYSENKDGSYNLITVYDKRATTNNQNNDCDSVHSDLLNDGV